MKRFKNPWAGSAHPEVARHLILNRGWTEEQLTSWYASLWDRLGPDRRLDLLCRINHYLMRKWILGGGELTETWVDHLGRTCATRRSPSGRSCSSILIVRKAA